MEQPKSECLMAVTQRDDQDELPGIDKEDRKNYTLKYLSLQMERAKTLGIGKVTDNHFVTDFHQGIYNELAVIFGALCRGFFKGKTGMFTKVLLGPRGVAKTTCLKNFVSAAPLLERRVISFFFSATSSGALPTSVRTEGSSLCKIVAESFGWEWKVRPLETCPDCLVRILEEKDERLVLVVDEVDQLFKAPASDELFFGFAHKSLCELGTLGNNTCGRLMIILSGSSSRLMAFIKGSKDEFLEREIQDFKMLSLPLNMNSNRYKQLKAVYPRPDSLTNALAILHPCVGLIQNTSFSKDQEKIARELMFARGCNPRALDDPANGDGDNGVLPHSHSCARLWTQLLVLWFGYHENRRLLVTLGKRKQTLKDRLWYGKWQQYKCTSCSKAKQCPHAVREFSWENLFVPITISKMYQSRGAELPFQLETLQYEGYLIMIGDAIYPVSAGKFLRNLEAWTPSFRSLLRRRYKAFCQTPQNQVDLLDDLSSAAKGLVKEALSGGISHHI